MTVNSSCEEGQPSPSYQISEIKDDEEAVCSSSSIASVMSREKTSKQADATGEADRTRQGQDVEAAGPRQPRPGRQNGSMCFFFLFVMFLYVVAIIGITVSAVSNDSFSKMGDGQSMGVSVTVDKSAMPKLDA